MEHCVNGDINVRTLTYFLCYNLNSTVHTSQPCLNYLSHLSFSCFAIQPVLWYRVNSYHSLCVCADSVSMANTMKKHIYYTVLCGFHFLEHTNLNLKKLKDSVTVQGMHGVLLQELQYERHV